MFFLKEVLVCRGLEIYRRNCCSATGTLGVLSFEPLQKLKILKS